MPVDEKWSYAEFEGKHIAVLDKLSTAMRTNPYLKVHVAFGYSDGATPYFAAEQTLARWPSRRNCTTTSNGPTTPQAT